MASGQREDLGSLWWEEYIWARLSDGGTAPGGSMPHLCEAVSCG